jgi:aryl-alcohol dehydrogenase
VVAMGSAVTEVNVGDRVVLSYDHCGRCPACVGGRRSTARLSDGYGDTAYSSFFGQSSFAEYNVTSTECPS